MKHIERNGRICALYKSGRTLASIGEQFGLTKQAIGFIVCAAGLTRKEGGYYKRTRLSPPVLVTKASQPSDLMQRTYARLGCIEELYRRLRAMHREYLRTPIGAYVQQRAAAAKRGIEFRLTLAEWWQIWEESGHYAERGTRAGQYQMARKWDSGAYAVGTVEIQTVEENRATVALRRRFRKIGPRYEQSIPERSQKCGPLVPKAVLEAIESCEEFSSA